MWSANMIKTWKLVDIFQIKYYFVEVILSGPFKNKNMPQELSARLYESFDNMCKISMLLLQALEKFLYEASSLLAKLEEIEDGLSQGDFADTLEGLKDQIKHNQHVKKWIVKAPVEVLQDEGEKLRCTIQNPEHSSDGFTPEDVNKAELQIQELVQGLHSKRQKLRELWNLRKLKLDQCYQYRVFQQDAEKVRIMCLQLSDFLLRNYLY